MGAAGLILRSNGVRYDQDGADAKGSCVKVRRLYIVSFIVLIICTVDVHGCRWMTVHVCLADIAVCPHPE